MKYSTEIANEFIRRAKANNTLLTQMQLQKLVYIAHGWYLAIHDTALTSDSTQAWDYGPVYPLLWEALKSYGSRPVTETIKVGDTGAGCFMDNADQEVVANLNEEQSIFIDKIYNTYAAFHAFQLSAMTHKQDTPWYKKYVKERNIRGIIDNLSIKTHFTEIAQNK